jgi:hypothetical protein
MKRQATGIASPNQKAYAQSVRVFGIGGLKITSFCLIRKTQSILCKIEKIFIKKE